MARTEVTLDVSIVQQGAVVSALSPILRVSSAEPTVVIGVVGQQSTILEPQQRVTSASIEVLDSPRP